MKGKRSVTKWRFFFEGEMLRNKVALFFEVEMLRRAWRVLKGGLRGSGFGARTVIQKFYRT